MPQSAETLLGLREELKALQKQNAVLQRTLSLSSGLRQRFEALFDESPLGLFSQDNQGQILEANRTLADLLETKPSQLISRHIEDFITPQDQAEFIDHLTQLRDNHSMHHTQCNVVLLTAHQHKLKVKIESTLQQPSDYHVDTIYSRVTPLENDPQHTASNRELTDEQTREHQEALAHMSRLNTMGEMASGLAHELNQPLTAIRSYTQSCLRLLTASPEKQAQVPKILNHVNTQAQRASSIIQHLRDFVSKNTTHREKVQLESIVKAAISMMHHELNKKDIALKLDIQPDLPQLNADAIQLEQVVLNLLRNASEAMDEITDKPRKLYIALRQPSDNLLCVSISDNGPGLTPTNLEKIATPFFSTKTHGMGLGLAISRTIIEDHGGKLRYKNNPNGGATFVFTLAINGLRPNTTTNHTNKKDINA